MNDLKNLYNQFCDRKKFNQKLYVSKLQGMSCIYVLQFCKSKSVLDQISEIKNKDFIQPLEEGKTFIENIKAIKMADIILIDLEYIKNRSIKWLSEQIRKISRNKPIIFLNTGPLNPDLDKQCCLAKCADYLDLEEITSEKLIKIIRVNISKFYVK
jgi:hypothetical protein